MLDLVLKGLWGDHIHDRRGNGARLHRGPAARPRPPPRLPTASGPTGASTSCYRAIVNVLRSVPFPHPALHRHPP